MEEGILRETKIKKKYTVNIEKKEKSCTWSTKFWVVQAKKNKTVPVSEDIYKLRHMQLLGLEKVGNANILWFPILNQSCNYLFC